MSHITTAELAAQMDALGIDREEVVAACRAGEEKVIRAGMLWQRCYWMDAIEYAIELPPEGGMRPCGAVILLAADGWRAWWLINPYARGPYRHGDERRTWRWVMTATGPDLEWAPWPVGVPVPARPDQTDGGLLDWTDD